MTKKIQLFSFMVLLLFSFNTFAKSAKPKPNPVATVEVYLPSTATMECTKTFAYDVRVNNFTDLKGLQFSINFDKNLLNAISVTDLNGAFSSFNINTVSAPNGQISFSWGGTAPVTLPNGDLMFRINFMPYYYGLTGGGITPVTLSGNPTPLQALSSTNMAGPVIVKSGTVKIVDKTRPQALCPGSQFYKGLDSVFVASIFGNASDDCGTASITNYKLTGANNKTGVGDANGKFYKLGVTAVNYTATDLAGNTSQCVFKIVLVKNSNDTLNIFAGSKLAYCEDGTDIGFGINIGNASNKDLTNLQFSASWDPTKFQYVGTNGLLTALTAGTTFNTANVANGQLGFSWTGAATNISDNSRLFRLLLTPIGNAGTSLLKFGALPVAMTATSSTLGVLPMTHVDGDMFIIDEFKPTIACKPDTLIYTPTPSLTKLTVNGKDIIPAMADNCAIEKQLVRFTGATSSVSTVPIATNTTHDLSYGTTNAVYTVSDYMANSASCSQNITVNALRFSMIKDSVPCSVLSKSMELKTTDFEKISDFSILVKYNVGNLSIIPSNITFYDNVIKSNCVVSNSTPGEILFKFTMPAGQTYTVPDNSVLMTFPFTLSGKVNSPLQIVYNSSHTPTMAASIVALTIDGNLKNFDNTKPVIANCPSNITDVVTVSGTCAKVINWTNPTITDNCDPSVQSTATITKTNATIANVTTFNGDTFDTGLTTVTYTAKDTYGNTSVCTFTVSLTENVAPVITTCTPDITVNSAPAQNGNNVTWSNPIVVESCGIASEVFTKAKNSFFVVGKQKVVYTVTDKSGNKATCTFNVTVVDNEKPVFSTTNFPADVTINTKLDTCGAFPTWTLPTATDNHTASNLIQITSDKPSGGFLPSGLNTITYSAKDSTGNIATKTFTINIIDNQPPKFINCPTTNVTLNATSGLCGVTYTPATLKTKDNCIGITNINPSNAPNANFFAVGTKTLTYVDPNNSSVTCSFDVIVKSIEKPIIACPADVTLNTTTSSCGFNYTLPAATVTDKCGVGNITATNNHPSPFYPLGFTTVVFTASDALGNSSTCSMKVTVVDKTAPTIVCPSNIVVPAEPNKDGATVTWLAPTVKDTCSSISSTITTTNPNTYFVIGSKTVTYTVTDQAGNTASCSFTVTVTDTQNPIINCPTNGIVQNADPAVCGKTVPFPTFTDNSGKTPTITISNGVPANNFYPVGTTTVSFTVKDLAGNTASCSYNVVIKDVTKPTFAATPDITVDTDPATCTGTFPASAAPTATDGCGNTNITITKIPNTNQFPVGTSTVTFTASDADGNSTSTQVKITVKDVNPPVITGCPNDITTNVEPNKNGATITWTPPTAKGFCNNQVTLTSTKNPNSFFQVGNSLVTYTATDLSNGKTVTCTFNVTVIDNQAPIINCPTNGINVDADPTTCGKVVTLPTFTDNSGNPATIVSATNVSANGFYPVGKTVVSFTVSDAANNTAKCEFTITVKDVVKPTFVNVKDVTLNADIANCNATLSPSDEPVAQDGCNNTNITVNKVPNLTSYPIGTTTVVYTATDQDGNKGVTSFKVIVKDNLAPSFNTCPSKIVTICDAGKNGAVVSWLVPVATDNCSVTTTSTNKPGDFFSVGSKIVTYTATDASGNTATCTFEVEVKDTEKPVIVCKDIIVNNDPGTCGAKITVPKATDNVAITNSTINPQLPANNVVAVGASSSYQINVNDAALNFESCTFNIKVSDNEAPKVSNCPQDLTLNAPNGQCKTTLNPLPKPSFTDNCDNLSLVITNNRDSLANPFEFLVGDKSIVTYYAKDLSGNVSKCSYKVEVASTLKPTITCPSNISANLGAQKCDSIINWVAATATAGCVPFTAAPKADIAPGSVFKSGASTVTYTVTDTKGNTAQCSFTVTLKETTAPTFDASFPKDITLDANASDCTASNNWSIPTASDNCDKTADVTVLKKSGPSAGDKLNIGSYKVVYTAFDKSANSVEKSFNITVQDKTAPVFATCPKDIKVNAAGIVLSDPSGHIATSVSQPTDCKAVVINFKPITATDACTPNPTITNNGLTKFDLGATTTYKYTAKDAAGNTSECAFTVTVVPIDAPITWIGNDKTVKSATPCIGDNVQLSTNTIVGATYTWTGPNNFNETVANPSVTAVKAINGGDYILKTNINGCPSPAAEPLKINVNSPITTGKNDEYSVLTEVKLLNSVLTNDGLANNKDVTVKVVKNVKNGTLTLNKNGDFEYISNVKYIGEDEFTYQICSVACPNICSVEIVAKINVLQDVAKIPNVLTPNGDGMNDAMIVDYPFTGNEKAELYIFNEWGHEVYRAVPYDNSKAWKATFKDQPVPDGTYYFIFIPDTNKAPQKGFVTVLR